jgi:Asp-tRNA(Asn)/Glu-tRNA(Gln) amidotransferase B subunit
MARYEKMMDEFNNQDWKINTYDSPDGNYRHTSYVKVLDLSNLDMDNSKEMKKDEYLKVKLERALKLAINNEDFEEAVQRDEKKARLMNDFGLSIYDASIVISDQDISEYYEEVAKNSDYKLAANWMIVELFGVLNKEGKEIKDSPVSAKNLSKLINLIKDNTISGKIAKTVFEEMVKNDQDPDKIVEDKGLKQQSDPKELEKIIETIVKNNQDKVEQYKSGKDKLFGFFVGQAMKETEGKGNPKLINDILKEKLK